MTSLKKKVMHSKFVRSVFSALSYDRDLFYFYLNPKRSAELNFTSIYNRKINWENPRHIEEKFHWMQFNTDTSLWTRCADKYAVRDYVIEHGCGNILNKLYGRWDDARDIDFDKLPDKFVIKTNNASGTVIIVENKNALNINKTVKKLNYWLRRRYGIIGGQIHYLKIKPCIIAEEYLSDPSQDGLNDYKCFCFKGEVDSIKVCSNRVIPSASYENHEYSNTIYSTSWERLDASIQTKIVDIPKPLSLSEMIGACRALGEGIPFVRIDFYEVCGKLYFGEMTFTPGLENETFEFGLHLGGKLHLEELKTVR